VAHVSWALSKVPRRSPTETEEASEEMDDGKGESAGANEETGGGPTSY
jgi:hypothetical protein